MAYGIRMETFPYSSFPGHRVKTIVQLGFLYVGVTYNGMW